MKLFDTKNTLIKLAVVVVTYFGHLNSHHFRKKLQTSTGMLPLVVGTIIYFACSPKLATSKIYFNEDLGKHKKNIED